MKIYKKILLMLAIFISANLYSNKERIITDEFRKIILAEAEKKFAEWKQTEKNNIIKLVTILVSVIIIRSCYGLYCYQRDAKEISMKFKNGTLNTFPNLQDMHFVRIPPITTEDEKKLYKLNRYRNIFHKMLWS